MVNHTFFLAVLILTFAGLVQGMTGFGFGLIAMPLLPLVMNFQDAVTLSVLLNLAVTTVTFFAIRSHYSWRQGLGMVVGTCLGVPIGVYALVQMNELLLRHFLGAIMCLFAANELLFSEKHAVQFPSRLSFMFGLASGGLSGAFNMGDHPRSLLLTLSPGAKSQRWRFCRWCSVLARCFGWPCLVAWGYSTNNSSFSARRLSCRWFLQFLQVSLFPR